MLVDVKREKHNLNSELTNENDENNTAHEVNKPFVTYSLLYFTYCHHQ